MIRTFYPWTQVTRHLGKKHDQKDHSPKGGGRSAMADLETHLKKEKELGTRKIISTRPTVEASADKPTIEILEGGGLALRKSMRVYKRGGTSYHRGEVEVIASRLSALLGVGNVPVTARVPRDDKLNLEEGTRQAWVPDSETLTELGPKKAGAILEKMWKTEGSDFRGVYLLDQVINNADRHRGNILQDKTGKIYAIDNGRGDAPGVRRETIRKYSFKTLDRPMRVFVSLPPKLEKRWKSISEADVEKAFTGMGEEHGMRSSDIYDRIQWIIEDGGSE
jgi:hypothetical protein